MLWKKVDIKVADSRVRKKISRRVKSIAEVVNDALNALEYSLNHDTKRNRNGKDVKIRSMWRFIEDEQRVIWLVKYGTETADAYEQSVANISAAKDAIVQFISEIMAGHKERAKLEDRFKQMYEARSKRIAKSKSKKKDLIA